MHSTTFIPTSSVSQSILLTTDYHLDRLVIGMQLESPHKLAGQKIVPDLWLAIVSFLEPSGLASLAGVNSNLNDIVHPILWKSISIMLPRMADTAGAASDPREAVEVGDASLSGIENRSGNEDGPGVRALKLLDSDPSGRFSQHVQHLKICVEPPIMTAPWHTHGPSYPALIGPLIARLMTHTISRLIYLASLDIDGAIFSDQAQEREFTTSGRLLSEFEDSFSRKVGTAHISVKAFLSWN